MDKCPHCGESHYEEGVAVSTLQYFPPVIKDGVNVNPDRNEITTTCRCLECGESFTIESVNGDRRDRAMKARHRRFKKRGPNMFDNIINELCRKFRDEVRDNLLEVGTEIFKKMLK